MQVARSASPLAVSSSTLMPSEQHQLKPLSLKTPHIDQPQRKKSNAHSGHRESRVRSAGAACWTWVATKCSDLFTLETPPIDAIPGAQQPPAANYSVIWTDGLDLTVAFHY